MKQCINQEIKYMLKSKYVIIFAFINILLCVSTLYSNYMMVEGTILDYTYCKESLEKDISVTIDDGEQEMNVSNDEELAAMKKMAEDSLYSVCPKYSIEFALLTINSMALLIMALFGAVCAMVDKTNNTIRVKVTRYKRRDIFISKHIVMIVAGVLIEAIAVFAVYLINCIYFSYFMNTHNKYEDLKVGDMASDSNIIIKLIIAFIVMIISLEVGFLIGNLLNNAIAVCGIVVIYSMLLPRFGKYDLKSCMGTLVAKFYDGYGSVEIDALSEINMMGIMSIISIIVVAMYVVNYFVFKKKSAY